MKLELNQLEIEEALVEYIGAQGISISDKAITVDMVAGRGANGFTAHITIEQDSARNAEPSAVLQEQVPELPEEQTDTTAQDPSDSSPLFN